MARGRSRSVPRIPHERASVVLTLLPPLARQELDSRFGDALNTVLDLESQLAISQQELKDAWNQASQHQQTISLLVSEKNGLIASAERLEELEPRERAGYVTSIIDHRLTVLLSNRRGGAGEKVAS